METLEARIAELIAPTLADMGYELVRVALMGSRGVTVQVMAERADRKAMDVDDCADISHAISAVLDVEDPISGSYALEVSSPGIDRPLTRPQDFERFQGFEARVESAQPIDGQKRFKGDLLGLRDGAVALATDRGEVVIPFDQVRKAKLVLTQALIAAAAEEAQQ